MCSSSQSWPIRSKQDLMSPLPKSHGSVRQSAIVLAGSGARILGRGVDKTQEHVARLARELTGSASTIAELSRGPRHQIETGKLRALGMTFGGEALLQRTIAELVEAHRRAG